MAKVTVNFGWQPGATLKYQAWTKEQIEITIGETALPEIDDGWYSVVIDGLDRGGVVKVKEGSVVVGFAEYQPEGLHRQLSP